MSSLIETDIAVIGGGPAGSTLGSIIKRYHPDLDVLILERERFPREHVGESQLPIIGGILDEMGVWDKVEAARFPIKIGATYRWGSTDDLWDFEFLPGQDFQGSARPAKYEGDRRKTAFQVERAVYDKILLDHAEELGCRVMQETAVRTIHHQDDEVEGLTLETGDRVQARQYVDASGNAAVLRRALRVPVDEPSRLKNVAFWDYWNDAEWVVTIGIEATRVNVMSLGYGWIWFIPIGPTRVSVGLVVPAEHYKATGKTPDQIYHDAVQSEPLIRSLLAKAKPDGQVRGTKDWSFVAERLAGKNWWLAGECAGFADPILAAGLSLTHVSARELGYILPAVIKESHDAHWLRRSYDETQRRRIRQHVRFADYWYSANAHFSDLKEFTRELARESGLELEADKAFQWLGTGGFVNDDLRVARVATFSMASLKSVTRFLGGGGRASWEISRFGLFRPRLEGATEVLVPAFHQGRILTRKVLERDGRFLPLVGAYQKVLELVDRLREARQIFREIEAQFPGPEARANALEVFEAMVVDGWIKGVQPLERPIFDPGAGEDPFLHENRDRLESRLHSD
ncbi:MAG: tryptophan 7-halogenase [Fimbriimonadaceae bacterium]|nr:tryptophan 7-halogenase [Fimbriimonadaceae bacterium]